METRERNRVLSVGELWRVFTAHILPILLAGALCCGLLFGVSKLIVPQKFASTATMYVLKQENAANNEYTPADYQLALNVVDDCMYFVKSHAVLAEVIDTLKLDISVKNLYDMISVENPDNTRVIEVTVETKNAELSKKIADCLCVTASEKIAGETGTEQTGVYEWGTLESLPCNAPGTSRYILAFIVGAAVAYAVFFARWLKKA